MYFLKQHRKYFIDWLLEVPVYTFNGARFDHPLLKHKLHTIATDIRDRLNISLREYGARHDGEFATTLPQRIQSYRQQDVAGERDVDGVGHDCFVDGGLDSEAGARSGDTHGASRRQTTAD